MSDIRYQRPVEGTISILFHAVGGIRLLGIHWAFCQHNVMHDDGGHLFWLSL